MGTRRDFLKVTGFAAAGLVMGAAPRVSAKTDGAARPNVILVMTDDQGYGDLGCHGNTMIRTPSLDKLHAESLRLTSRSASRLSLSSRIMVARCCVSL